MKFSLTFVSFSSIAAGLFSCSQLSYADSGAVNLKILQKTIQEQQKQINTLADEMDKRETSESNTQAKPRLTWGGYGVINYQQADFFENSQDNAGDKRATTDVERIVFEPKFDLGNGYRFQAEIEFEHGGTGSTVEFEPEEAGEFEAEIEKGGEVILEQAQLIIEHSPKFNIRVGEIPVPFGMVNTHHQPSQYFTLQRSLAETNLIPSVWHETGIGLFGEIGKLRYEGQLITALDSSGFSGFNFVRGGMQSKLELDNADDLALIGSLDYYPKLGLNLGGSFYYGDSAGNRPRKNLDVAANVTLAEVHGRYERGPLAIRGEYLQGTIDNSDKITQANLQTFNGGVLGVSKTPVGHKAESYFIEVGYDAFSLLERHPPGKLIGFARYEAYDTHAGTEGNIAKVDRYDRDATTIGLNYQPKPGVIFKTEFSQREHAGSIGNKQDTFGLGVGFEF